MYKYFACLNIQKETNLLPKQSKKNVNTSKRKGKKGNPFTRKRYIENDQQTLQAAGQIRKT